MLSNKDFTFINKAIHASTKSTMMMRHGCVVVENNTIIGTGYNSYRTQFGDKFIKESCSCHAELHALREVMKQKSKKTSKKCGQLKVAKVQNE
jgi:deoxycytidylate deaminase